MITQIDLSILDAIQTIRTFILDVIFIFITHLGDKGIVWIGITLMMLMFKKTRKCGIMIAVALILGTLTGNLALKIIIARARPFFENPSMYIMLPISPPGGYSCPSGHTLSSFASAFSIFLNNKKLGIPALILASLIGFSRCYLYVHYLTDVLFGAVLGIGVAFLSRYICNKFILVHLEKRGLVQ